MDRLAVARELSAVARLIALDNIVLDVLAKAGFRKVDFERSDGATKRWYKYSGSGKPGEVAAKAMKEAGLIVKPSSIGGSVDWFGTNFTFSQQGSNGLFLAQYRPGEKGEQYRHGLDV